MNISQQFLYGFELRQSPRTMPGIAFHFCWAHFQRITPVLGGNSRAVQSPVDGILYGFANHGGEMTLIFLKAQGECFLQ